MTPDQVREIVVKAVADGLIFPWWYNVISLVFGFVCAACLLPYITRKVQHLADKEGKPLTASEVLKAENYLNAKRDTYYEAINTLLRFHQSVPWSGPKIPSDRVIEGTQPNESEVNSCFAKISLFTSDSRIPSKYYEGFQSMSVHTLGELIGLMRKDLGYGELPNPPEEYRYYFKRNPQAKA